MIEKDLLMHVTSSQELIDLQEKYMNGTSTYHTQNSCPMSSMFTHV